MDSNIFILIALISPMVGGIVNLFVQSDVARRWIGLGAGFASWGSAAILLLSTLDNGPQTYRLGNWMPPYGIVLVGDILSSLFVFMASSVLLGGYIYIISCKDESLKHPAFMTLFMSMQTGLLGAFLTGDIFTLFVFMELMVISSVAMVAISDNPLGLEAAVKYIFISSMGTMFLLIGISTIYATYGTLNLANLSQLIMLDDTVLLERASAIMPFFRSTSGSQIFTRLPPRR
jgi:multicomponent Na+:H+ antiporter subunit D